MVGPPEPLCPTLDAGLFFFFFFPNRTRNVVALTFLTECNSTALTPHYLPTGSATIPVPPYVNTGNTPRLAPHYLNTYPRAALPQYLSSHCTTALPSSILPLPILQGLGLYREKIPF